MNKTRLDLSKANNTYGAALLENQPPEKSSCSEKIVACWRRFFCCLPCCLPKDDATYDPISPAKTSQGTL